jgi:predicted flap endonuclease-1-like 5' DNA nuclease
MVAALLARAATTYGIVLQRAIDEAGVTPPEVGLTLDTVLAAIKIPIKTLQKRLADAGDRRAVEQMYDELQATGRVETHLPADDRAVRSAYADEVLAKVAKMPTAERFPYRGAAPPETSVERAARLRDENRQRARDDAARRIVVQIIAKPDARPRAEPARAADHGDTAVMEAPRPAAAVSVPVSKPMSAPASAVSDVAPKPSLVARLDAHERTRTGSVPSIAPAPPAPRTYYLSHGDDIVDAPSIGPKTALRLNKLGLKTVGDLLEADAQYVAEAMEVRHVTPQTVRDWQDQARLVIAVPDLRGTHAQLIVGAGFRDAATLGATSTNDLCAAILAYASSSEGQRVLREGDPPDMEAIVAWGERAKEARAA